MSNGTNIDSYVGEVYGIYTIIGIMPEKNKDGSYIYKGICSECEFEKRGTLSDFKNCVAIESTCDISLLSGHYEGVEFVAPKWYNELIQKEKPVLVINEINSVSKVEQRKFVEILKARQIGQFKLPEKCAILITCKNLKENPINEEIYSLIAHI